MTPTPVGRVFILESPNAVDLLEERGERSSLEQVCRLFGHDAYSFLLRDSRELQQTLTYISSIGWSDDAGNAPLFIHISVHGNAKGIAVGPDDISWDGLTKMITKMYKDLDKYQGPIVIILSACGAEKIKLTDVIRTKHESGEIKSPPEFIFVFSDEAIYWTDAVVTWTIFYHRAASLKFKRRDTGDIKELLKQIRNSGFGTLKYYRWDLARKKYLHHTAKTTKKGA